MKTWIKGILAIAILAGAGYWIYQKYKPEPELPVEAPAPITFQVTQATLAQKVQVKGKSAYAEQTEVFAPFSAKIREWRVKNGQQVQKGDLLFTLDTQTLQSEAKQLESEIEKTRVELDLNKLTLNAAEDTEPPGATEEERKKAYADRETKRQAQTLNEKALALKMKELQAKKAIIGNAAVHAGAAGVFVLYDTENKTRMASEGQVLGAIVNTDKLQFLASISEADMFLVKPGMSVSVKATGNPDLKLSGKVSQISKFAQKGVNTDPKLPSQFDMVIDLEPSPGLIGGLSLEGTIETLRKENVIAVPSLGILRDKDTPYVMLDKGNGQPEKRVIRTGLEVDDLTEVLDGLKPGDAVLIS